jgi:D-3-phosphoglycerate dehydrogenase
MKGLKWEKKKFQGRELFNKTLGIIGIGKIGSIVADRAKGLKMKVIAYDPFIQADMITKQGNEAVTLDELYKRSDYITIHVPKTKDTLGMINAQAFGKMKKGPCWSTARGGVVDEKALFEALTDGSLAAARWTSSKRAPGLP